MTPTDAPEEITLLFMLMLQPLVPTEPSNTTVVPSLLRTRNHVAVPLATALALVYVGRPLPNAALLGGFAALTGQVTLEALERAILNRFPGDAGEANVEAARAAYDLVIVRDDDEVTAMPDEREVVDRARSD